MMTDEEHELLTNMCNQYYVLFSALIAQMLKSVPEHLHADALVMLEEHSSVHGSNYEGHM